MVDTFEGTGMVKVTLGGLEPLGWSLIVEVMMVELFELLTWDGGLGIGGGPEGINPPGCLMVED